MLDEHFTEHKSPINQELNSTMARFSTALLEILNDNLLAVILFGSAVLNDFIPGRGDLDFMVVTKKELESTDCPKIMDLHDEMRSGAWGVLAAQLEGTYYPLTIVQDPLRAEGKGCYIGTGRKGWREITNSQNNLFDFAIITRYGQVCYGDTEIIKQFYQPTQAELRKNFCTDLKKNLDLSERDLGIEWVLSVWQWVPRGLCTYETGQFLSKRAAAKWFSTYYEHSPWSPLVAYASLYRLPLEPDEKEKVSLEVSESLKPFLSEISNKLK